MCLCIPGKIIEVTEAGATVDFWGIRKLIQLVAVDEPVAPGDYVLTHVGYAIRRIPENEIGQTLAFYDTIIQSNESDWLAADLRSELDAEKGAG